MLSLEQCKKLAEWGLLQELSIGDLYYVLRDGDKQIPTLHFSIHKPLPYVKIPDLEELMEFARTVVDSWHLAPDPKSKSWWVEWDPSGLIAEQMQHPWHGFEADIPIQAVYQLCAYYFEKVKDENDSDWN